MCVCVCVCVCAGVGGAIEGKCERVKKMVITHTSGRLSEALKV